MPPPSATTKPPPPGASGPPGRPECCRSPGRRDCRRAPAAPTSCPRRGTGRYTHSPPQDTNAGGPRVRGKGARRPAVRPKREPRDGLKPGAAKTREQNNPQSIKTAQSAIQLYIPYPHLSLTRIQGRKRLLPPSTHRHRGESHLSSPATPPDMRVRIRRFGWIELWTRRTTLELQASRSRRWGTRSSWRGCWRCAMGRERSRLFVPARCSTHAPLRTASRTVPCRVSIASRSRIAACAVSIDPDSPAPRASRRSRSSPSSHASSWPVPSSSARY